MDRVKSRMARLSPGLPKRHGCFAGWRAGECLKAGVIKGLYGDSGGREIWNESWRVRAPNLLGEVPGVCGGVLENEGPSVNDWSSSPDPDAR